MRKIQSLLIIFFAFISVLNAQEFYELSNVNTIEITFEESNWDQLLDNLAAAGDEERLLGSVTINGEVLDSVGVRYKGNSSYNSNQIKNPFNIKLDYIIDDQGVDGYSTLKLSNEYNDPSFIRETMSYEIARKYMPAPLSNYANVYVNGTYMGLYTSNQDVDKTFMQNHFYCNDNVRFKGELGDNSMPGSMGGVWEYFGTDSADYANKYAIESDYGWAKLITFLDVLNNDNQNIEDELNVDRHLWFLAFSNLIVNLDGPINNPQNYYLFEDASGRFNPIPWDFNESFGVFSMLQSSGPLSTTQMQQLSPFVNSTDSEYPVISKILDNDEYKKIYVAHMKTIIDENFTGDLFENRALEIQAYIDADVQADPNKFFTYTNFIDNVNSSVSVGGPPPGGSKVGLTELMDARVTYLQNLSDFQAQAPVLSNSQYSPEVFTVGEDLAFTVEAEYETEVFIGYRYNNFSKFEKLELFDDGNHSDGAANDGIYGNTINVTSNAIQYYYYSLNNDAAAFLPAKAQYEFFTAFAEITSEGLVINEFMADNETTIADQDGEFDDWIELYNNSDSEITLTGFYLTDDAAVQDQWAFPEATIAPGGYLIVWADKDEEQEGLHADLKLSASGETIILSDNQLNIIDEITFGAQNPDISTGRYPNGTGDFIEMSPTFNAENNDGVLVESFDFDVNIYPNPVSQTLVVSSNINISENTTLKISNSMGQIVILQNTNLFDKTNIDVSCLQSGIYILSIMNNTGIYTQKFIKQ